MPFILKTYFKYAQFLSFLPTESQRTLRVPEKRQVSTASLPPIIHKPQTIDWAHPHECLSKVAKAAFGEVLLQAKQRAEV